MDRLDLPRVTVHRVAVCTRKAAGEKQKSTVTDREFVWADAAGAELGFWCVLPDNAKPLRTRIVEWVERYSDPSNLRNLFVPITLAPDFEVVRVCPPRTSFSRPW